MKTRTSKLAQLAKNLLKDETGGELIEWVLIAGLHRCRHLITTVAAFGTKVMAKWTSVNASM